jgi:hypothetical protein
MESVDDCTREPDARLADALAGGDTRPLSASEKSLAGLAFADTGRFTGMTGASMGVVHGRRR